MAHPSIFVRATARLACVALAVGATVRDVSAQASDTPAADRARIAELSGDTTRHRLPELVLWRRAAATSIAIVRPTVDLTWNSALPYSMNDGALWAGRGVNVGLTGGISVSQRVRDATIRVAIAPSLLFSQNRPFQTFPSTAGGSSYANPFHDNTQAPLDLPHRFGDRYLLRVDPGASSISMRWPFVVAGVTTENERWGPGIRNALILSENAPGIPRAFVRTAQPVRTRYGFVEARLMSGALTNSLYSRSDTIHRSISGALVELRPAFDTTLTLGLSRVVYAPVTPGEGPVLAAMASALNVLMRWENLDGVGVQRSDQISAIFARWIVPAARLEVYGEFARMDLPRTPGELLVAPHHTSGWTVGGQWLQPQSRGHWLRAQAELTYLEQTRAFPDRVSPDFYSGMASSQGYTNRGQVIGAAIGPGASSQWLAVDWVASRWQAGGFAGRIRWDNDALYRQVSPTFFDHDVSLLGGVRGSWSTGLSDFSTELTWATRYNYLFQNGTVRPGGYRTVDVRNVTVRLRATPR
jgi:hypothetical protein